jgi:cell wall-associated NlpC family hydrolase
MDRFISKAIGGDTGMSAVPWVDKGRSFAGWDCWGLIVLLYREVFRVGLPSYEAFSCVTNDRSAIRTMISEAKKWIPIPGGQEKPGDIIALRPLHTGVVYKRGRMIHCLPKTLTCLEHYNGILWRNRLIGYYRHADLA